MRIIRCLVVIGIAIITTTSGRSIAAEGKLKGFGILQFGMDAGDQKEKLDFWPGHPGKVKWTFFNFEVQVSNGPNGADSFSLFNRDFRMPCCSGTKEGNVQVNTDDIMLNWCRGRYQTAVETTTYKFESRTCNPRHLPRGSSRTAARFGFHIG